MQLGSLPLLDRLEPCRRILLAGCGGGFDVLAAVPLRAYLHARGKQTFLASMSFSELGAAHAEVVVVGPDTPNQRDYFPEKYLSAWYAARGQEVPVYCYKPTGTRGILEVFQHLSRRLELDALVLVDGGTDSLMRGDEPGLGTPAEDMVSLAAADMLELPVKLLVNLGFGVDTFHEVCHAYVLEAVAELTEQGAFLGAFSLLPGMPELQELRDCLDYICGRMPGHESIVMTSVVAAGWGRFGDFHPTERTRGSQLFLNPLMSMYWAFEVSGVARRCLYLDYLKDKYNRWDVHRAISNYLYTVRPRPWLQIPL